MATNTRQTIETSTKNILCKYFINGVCRKGDDCIFSHDRSHKTNNVCRYYLKGSCSYGKGCRFDHTKPSKNACVSEASIQANTAYLNEERPSKLVSLKKATTSSHAKEKPQSWVDAPDFVPGRKSHPVVASDAAENTTTKKENISYSEVAKNGVEYILGEMSEEEASVTLCPYIVAEVSCELSDSCPYFHGLRCDICNNYCLDPKDQKQQKEHKEECMKALEENISYSFAVQKSEDVTCGICLEKIRLNSESKDKRFGILPECNHGFCLSCIRKWRSSSTTKDKFVRACPLCRKQSGYVIPSELWVDDPEEKTKLIQKYKDALSSKPCKHFDCGKGTCPFGTSCFYKHALPDGTIVTKVNMRRYDDSEGESRIINPLNLWEFIEARDVLDFDDLDLDDLDDLLEYLLL